MTHEISYMARPAGTMVRMCRFKVLIDVDDKGVIRNAEAPMRVAIGRKLSDMGPAVTVRDLNPGVTVAISKLIELTDKL